MLPAHWIAGGAVLLCGTAAWWDLRHRRIPNAITLPAVVIALCLHGATHSGQGLLLSIAGAFIAAAVVLPGYAMGFTGGGDVKLLAAVGALLAFPTALFAALLSLVLGGAMSALVSLWRRDLGGLLARTFHLVRWIRIRAPDAPASQLASRRTVPLGLAIALATLLLVFGPWPESMAR